MKIGIANRLVGDGESCFIIAEAGVNHNGEIKLAKKLVALAAKAGANAVKFQAFKTEDVVTRNAEKARYQKITSTAAESQFEMIRKLELTGEDFEILSAYARVKNILFLATPFDRRSVDMLDKLDVPAFKVSSGDITNFPLLRYIAERKKPIILSTGMSTLEDIEQALNVIRKGGVEEIILLHCVSVYPARVKDMNLRALTTLRRTFELPVGLSDHTQSLTVPIAAWALGACIIEKHFTLRKDLPGPDHSASLESQELRNMISAIRELEVAMGDGIKRPTKEEEENKKDVQRSIVAKTNIPKGTIIIEGMLDVKRPGIGIAPKNLDMIIGRKTKEAIERDELITFVKLI